MLKYELEKILNGKRVIVLFVLLITFNIYFAYRLSLAGSFRVSEAFDDYRSTISFYEVCLFVIDTVFVAYLFPYEEQCHMSQILRTSRRRDDLVLCKIYLALVVTNILAVIGIVISIVSYCIAFEGDFCMGLYGYAADFTKNPNITNTGQVLILILITYFIAMNVNAMLVILLSVKTGNPFRVCIILPVAFTVCITLAAIIEIPVIDTIMNITPYNCVGDYESVEVIFCLGDFQVTPYLLEWIIYIIGFIVLLRYLKKVYSAY